MKVKNDLIRARRWYILMMVILAVVFVGYYVATGQPMPRYESFFRNHPWYVEHLMQGDLARIGVIFATPLMIVMGALLMRQANGGARGYTEYALLGLAVICAATGVVMLPFGVKAGLAFWALAAVVMATMIGAVATFRFVFSKTTWRRLGDWLGGKDVEEAQKNGDQPTAVISSCGETKIVAESAR